MQRGISIENNFKKKFGVAYCSLEYCVIIIINWSLTLSSSIKIEKKDTPGQNPFDINIRTLIAFHHMNLEKGIVG